MLHRAIVSWAVLSLLTGSSIAAGQGIRGQWDFDQGDLHATIGKPLEYFDPASNGQTAAKSRFGTTATFGISSIGGQPAGVMRFPACQPNEGYILHTDAPPNGGGQYINQYTLIMDLMYPATPVGWRSIFQTNLQNADDGEFFIHPTNTGIGISGQYHGSFSYNAWHRLAVTVDLTASRMAKFIDGVPVGTQTLGSGLDGRWSLYSQNHPQDWLLLLTDEDGETLSGYVNSIQFRDYTMSAFEVAALGGPSASGIPQTAPAYIAHWDFNGSLNAATASPALIAGAAAPETTPVVQFVTTSIAGGQAQVASFSRGTFFRMTHGLQMGGSQLNQYSLILDAMFPSIPSNGWAALWQTDTTNSEDGEWYIRGSDHAIGISGNYAGNVPDGTWNRLTLVVDASAGTFTSYINGTRVQQNTSVSPNSRWTIGAEALLFADDNMENSAGLVNSVQLRPYAMSDAEITLLGGPSHTGIPIPLPPSGIQVVTPNGQETWQAGTSQIIRWGATGGNGLVAIELYEGGQYRDRIADAFLSEEIYVWNILPSIGDSSRYRVRIRASAFPEVQDQSDADFTIFGSVEPTPVLTKLPMLQGPCSDSMTLLWETDVSRGTQAVEWGLQEVSENSSSDVVTTRIDASHSVHEARFGPLQAETVYEYRVRSGNTYSPVFSFRTAPRRATPTRIVWFADEQGYSIFRQQVPVIAGRNPDLILVAGDLMNDGGSVSEWHEYWFKSLEISNLAQTTPILFARGNHDGEGWLAYTYSALPGNESWFAFTYGNARYIVLNSNLPTSSRPEQLAWLQAELASPEARQAQFRVAVFHKPAFTDLWDGAGYTGEAWIRSDWVPLFEQHQVDLVVGGHTHAYLRGSRNGVMHTIVGGAGNVLDTYRSANWGFFDVLASVHHHVVMEVDRNRLRWTAWNINGSLLDQFELSSRTPVPPADLDGDHDVDQADLEQLQACLSGPGIPRLETCTAADFDGDGDVDQCDFAELQACYAGPGATLDPACRP